MRRVYRLGMRRIVDCERARARRREVAQVRVSENYARMPWTTGRTRKVETGRDRVQAHGPVHMGAAGVRGIISESVVLPKKKTRGNDSVSGVATPGAESVTISHGSRSVHVVVLIVLVLVLASAAICPLADLGATICCHGLRGQDDRTVCLQNPRAKMSWCSDGQCTLAKQTLTSSWCTNSVRGATQNRRACTNANASS